ncbi:unnamed protein product [marine sediment metagenome]|uniref:Uncharacterized protein n=1 Tax=marine sediment metagenome TaxID=412755 RepID=X1CUU8_9ZZZZ
MVLKYSKVFTIVSAVNKEPVTILVEYVETDGFKGIGIQSLTGKYDSPEEFEKAYKRQVENPEVGDDKIYNFLPMKLTDAHRLIDTLNEAITASKEN